MVPRSASSFVERCRAQPCRTLTHGGGYDGSRPRKLRRSIHRRHSGPGSFTGVHRDYRGARLRPRHRRSSGGKNSLTVMSGIRRKALETWYLRGRRRRCAGRELYFGLYDAAAAQLAGPLRYKLTRAALLPGETTCWERCRTSCRLQRCRASLEAKALFAAKCRGTRRACARGRRNL
jgi:hypothetical protein